jgi:hypothetical protein
MTAQRTQPAVHYNNALNPAEFRVPICRPSGATPGMKLTTQKGAVTCQRCRRALGCS